MHTQDDEIRTLFARDAQDFNVGFAMGDARARGAVVPHDPWHERVIDGVLRCVGEIYGTENTFECRRVPATHPSQTPCPVARAAMTKVSQT